MPGDSAKKQVSRTTLLFVYRRNRTRWLESWQAGEASSEFLYGMPYLDKSQFDVDFVEGDDTSRDWKQRLCLPFERRISTRAGIGFGLHISWKHWQKIRRADVLISTFDTYACRKRCWPPLMMNLKG